MIQDNLLVKWIREKLDTHRQFLSSFGIMIFLTLIGNLFQVASFFCLKKLDTESFAQINFGIYVFVLLGIVTAAFGKWLTIELSKINPTKRFSFFVTVFKKSFLSLAGIIIVVSSVMLFFTKDSALIIFLCCVTGILSIGMVFVYSWINARERFFFLGLLAIISPLIRFLTIVFFVSNENIWVVFVGFIFATLLSTGLACLYIYHKDRKILRMEEDSLLANIAVRNVMFNTILQTLLNVFWIADGVVLKNVLSDEIYNIYVCYAYVFKFPLFICVSIIAVLLGKNIFEQDMKYKFIKVFRASLLLVIASFGGVLLVEFIREGLILSVLGYSDMVVRGLVYLFGFAWLVQMVLYFLFSFLLKMKGRNSFLYWLIALYSLSFVGTLMLFNQNIFDLMKGVLIQGLAFILVLIVRFSRDLFGDSCR